MRTTVSEDALKSYLSEVGRRWPTQEDAIAELEQIRWKSRPCCIYCGNHVVYRHTEPKYNIRRWQCSACKRSFSVITGTVFHRTHVSLRVWVLVVIALLNTRKKVRASSVQRTVGLPYQTAWSVVQRIRHAMILDADQADFLRAIVEADDRRSKSVS